MERVVVETGSCCFSLHENERTSFWLARSCAKFVDRPYLE